MFPTRLRVGRLWVAFIETEELTCYVDLHAAGVVALFIWNQIDSKLLL